MPLHTLVFEVGDLTVRAALAALHANTAGVTQRDKLPTLHTLTPHRCASAATRVAPKSPVVTTPAA